MDLHLSLDLFCDVEFFMAFACETFFVKANVDEEFFINYFNFKQKVNHSKCSGILVEAIFCETY